jgi:hypothetical protein
MLPVQTKSTLAGAARGPWPFFNFVLFAGEPTS